jgi:hypothetical protein
MAFATIFPAPGIWCWWIAINASMVRRLVDTLWNSAGTLFRAGAAFAEDELPSASTSEGSFNSKGAAWNVGLIAISAGTELDPVSARLKMVVPVETVGVAPPAELAGLPPPPQADSITVIEHTSSVFIFLLDFIFDSLFKFLNYKGKNSDLRSEPSDLQLAGEDFYLRGPFSFASPIFTGFACLLTTLNAWLHCWAYSNESYILEGMN